MSPLARIDERADIRRPFGPDGVTGYESAFGGRGAITDDTQMTLFTAEALLRDLHRRRSGSPGSVAEVGHRAYLRWLHGRLLSFGWLEYRVRTDTRGFASAAITGTAP